MNRFTVRLGAAASAAAVTLFELVVIAAIADFGSLSGDPGVTLPRVVVTPLSAQPLTARPSPRT